MISGYLRRMRLLRWAFYILGAISLGYLFNLIRLCALVLYYRVAIGHPQLERLAKQADYAIGGCLVLVGATFLLGIASRRSEVGPDEPEEIVADNDSRNSVAIRWRMAGFAAIVGFTIIPGVQAIRHYRKSFAASVRDADISRTQLDSLMPRQIGEYKLSRVWQEEENRQVKVESAAYRRNGGDEIALGVWIAPNSHSLHDSWKARGVLPLFQRNESYLTARDQRIWFDTAFYSDGMTDSLAGNVFCTPSACFPSQQLPSTYMFFSLEPIDFSTRGSRAVSIFFRLDAPHRAGPREDAYEGLAGEARRFLVHLDFTDISLRFQ